MNKTVRKNGSFIDIDSLYSLRYLDMEGKDYNNIVTWDNQNLDGRLNKFHLKLTIKDYEFDLLNKLPSNRLLSLHLQIKSG